MSIFDIANDIYEMGYSPVPLIPGEKRPIAGMWQKRAAAMDRTLWRDCEPDNTCREPNVGMYCGQLIIVIDGDAKDEAGIGVTGKRVMDWLWTNKPEAFAGAIMEITAGGGSHTTYRWSEDAVEFPWANTVGKTYCVFTHEDVPIIPEGAECHIEVLTRNAQSVSPPSVVNGRPYKYVSAETHATTPRYRLPELHQIFRDANHRYVDAKVKKEEEGRRRAEENARKREESMKHLPKDLREIHDHLTSADMEVQREALVDAYARTARVNQRHKNALGLARRLAGMEYSYSDVERSVREYFGKVSREDRVQGPVGSPKEINDIVDDAVRNPDKDIHRPWRAIIRERVKREKKLLEFLNNADVSDETKNETKGDWDI